MADIINDFIKGIEKDFAKDETGLKESDDNDSVAFSTELAVTEHIGKMHTKKLAKKFLSDDYIMAKLESHEREYVVNSAVVANQADKINDKIIFRFEKTSFTDDYIKNELNKFNNDKRTISQDIMLPADIRAILKRNQSNNPILSHLRGSDKQENPDSLDMNAVPEEWRSKLEKYKGMEE